MGNDRGPSGLEVVLSCLWVATPLLATLSAILVGVGVVTNQWLHTSEKMSNPTYNGTGDKEFLVKQTMSGLWVFCYTNPGETLYQCNMIEYFSEEVYNPDPNDSSQAIPYTVTKSIVFILLGSIFVVVGYVFCILGQCMDQKSRFTLLSGVIFIQTGLAMLCGLIMYIAVFKSEVGSKLRPKSHLQPPAFSYYYGYSFCAYVTGVVTVKLTGVSSVFLYIYRARYEWRCKRAHAPPVQPPADPPVAFYPCKRHPNAYVETNSSLYRPCRLHHSNSLRDVSFFPPEAPYRYPHHFSTDDVKGYGGLPRDGTANTVCTTLEYFDDEFSMQNREREFVRFDMDGLGYEVDVLRRTTPV